ncbi:Zeta toxin family protein [Thiohalocapsa halophila]|uniref:Zeta toxin family protein n=1 Tax=Thiohalocapsa halophila TaxID=69359 RepID=A0ABS1CFF7_9GAMM|nr:AAA family ATPase [Thiohalocapsa halophila]MBK1630629.1 Zeta toxin family protein [Thiohalocapsa halophila]
MTAPRVLVIAGPNGAGKTTFARELLPNEAQCLAYINADLIAAGLSPFSPERAAIKAARLMLDAMDEYAARRESFTLESTLSGRGYLRRFQALKAAGYRLSIYFLSLPNADMAIARVAERVHQGGHTVPDAVVRRRFASGWQNFVQVYRPMADEWVLLDSSDTPPSVIDWGESQ